MHVSILAKICQDPGVQSEDFQVQTKMISTQRKLSGNNHSLEFSELPLISISDH